jgi:hypothetical protein
MTLNEPSAEGLRYPSTTRPGFVQFAAMAGSSIATPRAAGWVTDFLNAAYYAHPASARDLGDLRLAHGVLATRWSQLGGRRLGARDVVPFHRAFGRRRLGSHGRLDSDALTHGAAALLGDWFGEAWADDGRRGYGIAFETVQARRAFSPEERLAHAPLRALTPPRNAPARQHWATYDPVSLPEPDAALALLTTPARWPDMGCAGGRFTALRSGGLLGQTFEIEVVAGPASRLPVFTRGHVTCTFAAIGGASSTQAGELTRGVDALGERYRAGAEPRARPMLPDGVEPLALVILTTHAGHFLGPALSHLLVWRDGEGAWIRDVGAWDPLTPHLAAAYHAAGKVAQRQFWGAEPAERSMLAQLAQAR